MKNDNSCDKCGNCDKKELIRKAAIKLISEQGFYNTTTDQVAKEAGVAVGTIYNYFENKQDILSYIFEREMAERQQFFCKINREELHPLEKIRELLSMHLKKVKENPALAKIILQEKSFPHKCYLTSEEGKDFEGLPYFINKLLEQAREENKIRNYDLKIVSLSLFGAIEAIMGRFIYEAENNLESDLLDFAADELVRMLWGGLAKEGSSDLEIL